MFPRPRQATYRRKGRPLMGVKLCPVTKFSVRGIPGDQRTIRDVAERYCVHQTCHPIGEKMPY